MKHFAKQIVVQQKINQMLIKRASLVVRQPFLTARGGAAGVYGGVYGAKIINGSLYIGFHFLSRLVQFIKTQYKEKTMEIKEITENYPLGLLLSADPDIKKIEKYLNKGRCFGLYDGKKLLGAYVLRMAKDATAEIENVAVFDEFQKRGYGRKLVQDAVSRAQNEGVSVLKIATGKDSFQQKFYESCGFKVVGVDEGYFERAYAEPIVENGQTLKDRVLMQIEF